MVLELSIPHFTVAEVLTRNLSPHLCRLTSTDYSIVVKNPPPEAYDPDEWRDFFAQFADKQVTAVTVALDNDTLLRKLIARRIHRNNLRRMLPKGTDLDDEDLVRSAVAQLVLEMESEPKGCILRLLKCTVFPALNLINMLLPPQTLVDKTFKLTEEIKELEKEKYNVSTVFVTFETEEGQRAALAALSVSKVDIMISSKANSAPSAIFHDRVLKVEEPTEPSAVRWLDLSASSFRKILIRVINLAITLSMVFVAGYFVNQTRENLGPALSGPLISIFNAIIPQIVKLLMLFERHTTEGSYQVSLYMKITLFRWANTAVLIQVITPFTSTVSDGDQDVLRSIHSILWSELLLVPGLRLLDLYGNFKKHIMAPRAINQAEMNHHFQGTFYNLGERYTDLTKVLFVCFFYSALFPLSFWFGAAILIVQYYVSQVTHPGYHLKAANHLTKASISLLLTPFIDGQVLLNEDLGVDSIDWSRARKVQSSIFLFGGYSCLCNRFFVRMGPVSVRQCVRS
jgi:hypothetical protein